MELIDCWALVKVIFTIKLAKVCDLIGFFMGNLFYEFPSDWTVMNHFLEFLLSQFIKLNLLSNAFACSLIFGIFQSNILITHHLSSAKVE
jgi:hypothetical protein